MGVSNKVFMEHVIREIFSHEFPTELDRESVHRFDSEEDYYFSNETLRGDDFRVPYKDDVRIEYFADRIDEEIPQ